MSGVPDYSRRQQAFNLYAQYRNMSKVGKELKIPTQTLFKWKVQEQWDEKLAQLRQKLAGQKEVLDKAAENFTLQKDLNKIKLIELLEEKVAEVIEKQTVQIRSWKDIISTLEFTTKEKRLLMGEPTEREINTIEVASMNEEQLDQHIKDLSKFLKPSEQPSGTDKPE